MSRALIARLDRIEAKIKPGEAEDELNELNWWLMLLCPEGGVPIPPRPKTRFVTLEMIVSGEIFDRCRLRQQKEAAHV